MSFTPNNPNLSDLFFVLYEINDSLKRVASALETIPIPIASSQTLAGVSTITFHATSVTIAIDESGKRIYRAKGDRFMKFGVRIWDEILPQLGLDPQQLQPGHNPVSLMVQCACNSEGNPKKVIGLA